MRRCNTETQNINKRQTRRAAKGNISTHKFITKVGRGGSTSPCQHLPLSSTGLGTRPPAPGSVTEGQKRQTEKHGSHKQPLYRGGPASTRSISGARGNRAEGTGQPRPRAGGRPGRQLGHGGVSFPPAAAPLLPLADSRRWAGPWLAARLKLAIQRSAGGGRLPFPIGGC